MPTVTELGYDGLMAGSYGIAGPKGMDRKEVRVLHDALHKATSAPAFEKLLLQQDEPNVHRDSNGCTVFAAQSHADETRFIGELKIKLDE